MLSQTSKRLVADPLVGVADLMQPLENLLQREKGINLTKYIQPPSTVSWKSAVPLKWLCKHQELFMEHINISKNTIISGKKHKLALEKLHHQYGDARGDDQDRGRPSLSRAGSLSDDLGASGGNALALGPNRNREVKIAEDVNLKIFGEA